jgi:hypothetical protein
MALTHEQYKAFVKARIAKVRKVAEKDISLEDMEASEELFTGLGQMSAFCVLKRTEERRLQVIKDRAALNTFIERWKAAGSPRKSIRRTPEGKIELDPADKFELLAEMERVR